MKNNLFCVTAAALILGASASVHAADSSVVTVTANIKASSCTISTNTLSIDLGDIQSSVLETAGSTSPWSPVKTISLTNCPAATTSVVAKFSGTAATNGDTNGYKNDGVSPNISVQLADDAATPTYYSTGKTATKTVQNHSAQLNLRSRLYSSGTAMPGAVSATINVDFEFK